MKVYVIIDTDTSARDSLMGVYASKELAFKWIEAQLWLSEDAKEFLVIIEDELITTL